ncbi:MAG: c-type cytochrome domain-containing protein [Planctomycetota bacterium]
MSALRSVLSLGFVAALLSPVSAQTPSYGKDVRPFLDKYCVDCHSGGKAKAGVHLDTYESLIKGGKRKLVTPGDPDKSAVVTSTEGISGHKMPPKKSKTQPTAQEISTLRAWVKAGAKDDSAKKSSLEFDGSSSLVEWALDRSSGERIAILADIRKRHADKSE